MRDVGRLLFQNAFVPNKASVLFRRHKFYLAPFDCA